VRLQAALLLHALVEDCSYNAAPLCSDPPTVCAVIDASYSAAAHLAGEEVEAQLQCVTPVASLLERCPPAVIVQAAPTVLRHMPAMWHGGGAGADAAAAAADAGSGAGGGGCHGASGASMMRRHVLKTLHTIFAAAPFALAFGGPGSAASPGPGSTHGVDAAAASPLPASVFAACLPLVAHSIDVRSADEVFLCRDGLELLAAVLETAPDGVLTEPALFDLAGMLPQLVARDAEHATAIAEVANAYLLRAGPVMLASPGGPPLPPTLSAAAGGHGAGSSMLVAVPASTSSSGPVGVSHGGCGGVTGALLASLLQHAPARSLCYAYAAIDNALAAFQATVAPAFSAAAGGTGGGGVGGGPASPGPAASIVSPLEDCPAAAAVLAGALAAPLTGLLLSLVEGDALRRAHARDEEEQEAAAAASRRRKEARLVAAFSRGVGGSGSSSFPLSSDTSTGSPQLSGPSAGKDSGAARLAQAIAAATGGADAAAVSAAGGEAAASVPPQTDAALASHGAAVLARLWLTSPSAAQGLLAHAASAHAPVLGACGLFSPDLAVVATHCPEALAAAGALRLLVWQLDAWMDAVEDVSLAGPAHGGEAGSGGASGGDTSVSVRAVSLLWRNKTLALACLGALPVAVRCYGEVSELLQAAVAAAGPAAAGLGDAVTRFLAEVNVLSPDRASVDAVSTIAVDTAGAAEALQAALDASAAAAAAAGATPGSPMAFFAGNALRTVTIAAGHVAGISDTPAQRRARARSRQHLAAAVAASLGQAGPAGCLSAMGGSGGAGGGASRLLDFTGGAGGGGDEEGDGEGSRSLVKRLLHHARSFSGHSAFRAGAGHADDGDIDAPEPEDDDDEGSDAEGAMGWDGVDGYGAGGEGGGGSGGGGPFGSAAAAAAVEAALLDTSASDFAGARRRLFGGRVEVRADVRAALHASFGALHAMLPPGAWESLVASRVHPALRQ
jgi:hypothetical protein